MKIISGLACVITFLWVTLGRCSPVQRIEVDLLRLMDGNFANATLTSTVTLQNGTAFAVFNGDQRSGQIDTLYIMIANASKYIAEVQLNKDMTSKLSTFSVPHNLISTENDKITFFLNNNITWNGNVTITLPPISGNLKYAMAAKISGGDPDSCSSFLSTYKLQNSAFSIPDRHVLDLYSDVNGQW